MESMELPLRRFGGCSFDAYDWLAYLDLTVDVPPFPWTEEEVTGKCPFNPKARLCDTHFAFYLPHAVTGPDGVSQPVTLAWWAKQQGTDHIPHCDWSSDSRMADWLKRNQHWYHEPISETGAWILAPQVPALNTLNLGVFQQRDLKPHGYRVGTTLGTVSRWLLAARKGVYVEPQAVRTCHISTTDYTIGAQVLFGPPKSVHLFGNLGEPFPELGMEFVRYGASLRRS